MEIVFPLILAAFLGISHAFEADHLIAVSTIVSRRTNLMLAVKDGMYWGLGHTTTTIIVGFIIIVCKMTLLHAYFNYFEAFVGIMLIVVGLNRLKGMKDPAETHSHGTYKNHAVAYQVGLIHGLAGSGALILIVLKDTSNSFFSLLYLLIFGIGSMLGMLLAASIFYIPFYKRLAVHTHYKTALIVISSALCLLYGCWIINTSLFSAG